jgi:beta-lactamase class A
MNATQVAQVLYDNLKTANNANTPQATHETQIQSLLQANNLNSAMGRQQVKAALQAIAADSTATTGVCYWDDNGLQSQVNVNAAFCESKPSSQFLPGVTIKVNVYWKALQAVGLTASPAVIGD